jgi:hypothetical protein
MQPVSFFCFPLPISAPHQFCEYQNLPDQRLEKRYSTAQVHLRHTYLGVAYPKTILPQ